MFGGRVYVNGGYFGGMYGFNGSNGNQFWFVGIFLQFDEWTPAVDGSRAYAYLGSSLTMQPVSTSRSSWTIRTATASRASSPIRMFEWDGWSMNQVAGSSAGAGEVLAIDRGVRSSPAA